MTGFRRGNEKSERAGAERCPFDEQGVTAAYALDALEGDERRAFEEHLPGCPVCPGEIASLRAVAAQLPLVVDDAAELGPDAAPSPALRARILDAVAAEARPAMAGVGAPPAPLPFPGRRLPQVYAMAAILLLALGLGLLGWNLTLQREVRELRSDVSRLATERDAALAVSNLEPTAAAGGRPVTGEVLYLRDRRQAMVTVSNLPPLQPGQVYQLWLIAGGPPEGAGVLIAPGGGTGGTMVQGDVTRYQRLAITIEPGPSGSVAPTTPPILAGTLDLD